MRDSRLAFTLVAFICLAGLPSARAGEDDLPEPAHAAGTPAFVQASFARVRAAPGKDAGTLTWLVTNTSVRLIALQEEWCEIEIDETPGESHGAANEKTRGFMSCDLLASGPLTLTMVEARLAGKPSAKSRLNWLSRAFWIAPSLTRWTAVGEALEGAYLDEVTQRQEIVNEAPQRFKVQEFEAMKQRLANGIRVTPEAYRAPSGAVGGLDHLPEIPEDAGQAGHRVPMPQIKSSHFGKNEIPVIFQDFKYLGNYVSRDTGSILSLIDALSAFNGAPFRVTVTEPAYYALHPEIPAVADLGEWPGGLIKVAGAMEVIVGIWDVGGLRATFEGNALLHGVTARGEPTARDVREIALGIGYDSPCSYSGSSAVMESKPVAGYAPSTAAILRWAGKPIPGGAGARASIRTQRLTGKSEYDQVLTHEIDLNRDGVADFLIWQGRYMPQVSAEGLWEAVFANIDGHWRLLRYDEDADCT
jgi:hypothetical protein